MKKILAWVILFEVIPTVVGLVVAIARINLGYTVTEAAKEAATVIANLTGLVALTILGILTLRWAISQITSDG